jgi:hypothetical protein
MARWLDRVKQKGEERFTQMVGELLGNERFMSSLETALSTKGYLERKVRTVLNTMSVASRLDVEELGSKLADVDRKLRQATKRLEVMQSRLDEATAKLDALASVVAVSTASRDERVGGRDFAASVAGAAEPASARAPDPDAPSAARGLDAEGDQPQPLSARDVLAAERSAVRGSIGADGHLGPPTSPGETGSSGLEAICGVCGKSFQKKTYNQRYCSAACRSAA